MSLVEIISMSLIIDKPEIIGGRVH